MTDAASASPPGPTTPLRVTDHNSLLECPDPVSVRLLRTEDAEPLTDLYLDNRAYLAPFEPERDDEFFTLAGQRRRVHKSPAQFEQGHGYPYVVELGGALVGE